jgi:uncharacterized damage-inducible protein DinB
VRHITIGEVKFAEFTVILRVKENHFGNKEIDTREEDQREAPRSQEGRETRQRQDHYQEGRDQEEGRREKEVGCQEEMTLDRLFLDCSIANLRKYTERITVCTGKLAAAQIWTRGGEQGNAIGNLVLHLCGNVRQWIVAGVGRQPDIRERDAEFDARGGVAQAELIARLRETVEQAVAVIERVTPERLGERLVVQGYDVSVLEAIYHVVEHFSHHTGQILFATKAFTGEDLGFYRHLSKAAQGSTRTEPRP